MTKVYQKIASTVFALRNCTDNDWCERHDERLSRLVRDYMPSGSGFNNGTSIDIDSCSGRLVFCADFHHMNEHGYYGGWTEHKIIVKPDLVFGFDICVTGRNKNDIKEYIADTFHHALNQDISE